MKKSFLLVSLALGLVGATSAQIRYIEETFSGVTVTPNVTYGTNFYVFPFQGSPIPPAAPGPIAPLGYTPTLGPINLDLYEPSGDVATNRPLVILVHTGNFLPKYRNLGSTGDKSDSSVVELSRRFAKRGYVAAAPRYRLGWNPNAATLVERTEQLLNAVYRAIHDVQTAVRFFKANAATYKIDPNKIVLVGVGSGGYVVNAYVTLNKQSETALDKFQNGSGNSVIDTTLVGNVHGVGGSRNQYNHSGFSNDVAMSINIGGALGDISWMEAGDVPMVGFHTWKDQFAPYDSGTVIVPTTGEAVVDVHGTRTAIKKAVALGNNSPIVNRTFIDDVSARGYSLNAKAQAEGLFEFRLPMTSANREEGSPWEWWDSASVVVGAQMVGLTAANGTDIHNSGVDGNQNMSPAKARRYIDTIMWYSAPRIAVALNLPGNEFVGINNNTVINTNDIALYPNPVSENFTITVTNQNVQSVTLVDINGKTIQKWSNLNADNAVISRGAIAAGTYIVKIKTTKGETSRQVIFK